ncbi:hypothetical protein QF001_000868 [Paraburkholderia youngii]|uniref:hypothetical protein n=1 Tax=Paraburkholderia youngii TaxID=2782701 RepID=UPI003D203027
MSNKQCTCLGGFLGHSRECAMFDESMMRINATAPLADAPKSYERHDPDNATAPFLSFIPDAKRDELIGALLASLEKSDQRETDFFMVRSFIGGLGLLAAQFAPAAPLEDAPSDERSTGICFFCGSPMSGVHESDCLQEGVAKSAQSDERARFEAWAYCNGWEGSLHKTEFGEYADEKANLAFAGWQARAQAPTTASALTDERIIEIAARFDHGSAKEYCFTGANFRECIRALLREAGSASADAEDGQLSTETVHKPVHSLTGEQREAIKYARSVMGSVNWETPDSFRAKQIIDALLREAGSGQ